MSCGYLNVFSILFDGTTSFDKTNCFSVDASILWCHKVLLFLYTSAILSSKDGLICLHVDSTASFRGYHYVKKHNQQLYKVSCPRRNYVNVGDAKITVASHVLF